MKNRGRMLGLALGVAFAGCGGGGEDQAGGSHAYSYEIDDNGCKTGAHSFNSTESYCAGLKDDSLNKGCARSIRRDYFTQAGCPGTF